MNPTEKFNTLLVGTTVSIMFLVIVSLSPDLHTAGVRHPILGFIAGLLLSAGAYRLLAIVLRWLMKRSSHTLSLVLGPSYMGGTWIGWFRGHSGELRYMIEYFNQNLDSLSITGRSFYPDGSDHGYWESEAVALDSKKGKLTFTYVFDTLSRDKPLLGIHSSILERKSGTKPPYGYNGFAHDLNDSTRIGVRSKKLSRKFISSKTALESAQQQFLNAE